MNTDEGNPHRPIEAEWGDDASPWDSLVRPAWHAQARCRGLGPELFYAETRGRNIPSELREFCGACPVRQPCLEAALDRGEYYGVWGGLSVKERMGLRRSRRVAS